MRKRDKRRAVALVLLAATFSFMGISYALVRAGRTNVVLNGVQTLFAPLQRGITKGRYAISDWIGAAANSKQYQEENARLKSKVLSQEQALLQAESIKKENARLRALLALSENKTQFDMVGCEIIAKNDGDHFFTIVADKGTENGIQTGDVAVVEQGLVGKVTAAGKNWAQITTILNPKSAVGIRAIRTETIAVAQGSFEDDSSTLCLSSASQDASFVIGDVLETSGLGGGYPKGLLVGMVDKIERDKGEHQDVVLVRPAISFDTLRAVMIIKMQ
ncbi:MAG: rod shape-determining protein MreC [Clostridia bacterium]|nr:rod shape-determining protein MreC [Clostridia bacterium]